MSHFFATKDDLLPMLAAVERNRPLKYVRMGRFLSPSVETFFRCADLPNLGVASSESAVNCATYLVCEPELEIRVRAVDQSDGIRSFHIDQLYNQDTMTFSPGGLWKPNILLSGRFAAMYSSSFKAARQLMAKINYQLRKHFTTIGAYYVGPAAQVLLKDGARLTDAEQSPRDFDLRFTYTQSVN